MALPSDVSYFKVKAQYVRAVGDGTDVDRNPDGVPISGLSFVFAPDVSDWHMTSDASEVGILVDPITATTNESGILVDSQGGEDVFLLDPRDPNLHPNGWSWKVSISGPSLAKRSFSFMAQDVVNLPKAVQVPANPGVSLEAWEAAVTATLANRAAAEAAAASLAIGEPGGVAGLDADGDVIDANGTKITSGGGGGSGHTHANLTILDATTASFTTADETKLDGIAAGATVNATDAALRDRATHTGTQSADTLTDGTTNKAFLATERTKLTGIATGATANATDAQLRDRATHTGTQTAATISDFAATVTSNTAVAANTAARHTHTNATVLNATTAPFTTGQETKLTGIATNATANSTDATLLARANHTGTQAASTITGLATVATSGAYADLSGKPTGVGVTVLGPSDPIPGGTPAGIIVRLAG